MSQETDREERRVTAPAVVAAAATSSASGSNNGNTPTTIEIDKQSLLSQTDSEKYKSDGFTLFARPFLSQDTVNLLCNRLQAVLAGEYDTGRPPTKTPAQLSQQNQKKKNGNNTVSVIHMINISHADTAFQRLALSPLIGEAVAKATGWPSVKFMQDQVWFKPPGSSALAFHCDSPYIDVTPHEVATLWITFEDLSTSNDNAVKLGPLEYCCGSHNWHTVATAATVENARRGSASQFFDPDYRALLRSAAERAGQQKVSELKIETVRAGPGGGSLHNGWCWHGSGPNVSTQPRRGIGIHYVRGDAKFRSGFIGKMWETFRVAPDDDTLAEKLFPTIWP